ncbi:MAG: BON domain-containing protein [Pyrinomonadaceae bacterium]|nr:BON domain-containing protein [Pyrinomonadaceae bacterium]
MRDLGLFFFILAVAIVAAVATGCNPAETNTNVANVNTRNANANTAVLVNANQTSNANRWSNTNISREQYDRDRADYERDRGDSTIGQGANDSWIWFKTRAALMTADDLRDSTINVDVVNDVITLRGTVANAAQKTRAETVAKGIEGQKGVKNQLTVRASDSMTNQMVNGSDRDDDDDRRSNTNTNRRQ